MSDNEKKFFDPSDESILAKAEKAKEFISLYGQAYGLTAADVPPFPGGVEVPEGKQFPICAVYLGIAETYSGWVAMVEGVTAEEDESAIERLALHPAIEQKTGVCCWLMYDPEANAELDFQTCWDDDNVAPNLAAAEVFMALAQEPAYLAAVKEQDDILLPNLAGYFLNKGAVEEVEEPKEVVIDDDDGAPEYPEEGLWLTSNLEIMTVWANYEDSDYSNPTVLPI